MQQGYGRQTTEVEGLVNVVEAVQRDLALIAKRDQGLSESALAAAALALAASVDDPGTHPTSRSLCAKELRETLERLRALAPAEQEADAVDELSARRARRRAG